MPNTWGTANCLVSSGQGGRGPQGWGRRGPSNTLGGLRAGPTPPRGSHLPSPARPPPAPVCPELLWQACPGPLAGQAAYPRGRQVKVGWDGGQGQPGSRPAPCVPHPVLNPTSHPAGGFPAASAPSPYPGRAGLLSKAGRLWEVPRPPQGALLGPGAHPRNPSVGRQCWGWYPETPDSPAGSAASGWGAGLRGRTVSPRDSLATGSPGLKPRHPSKGLCATTKRLCASQGSLGVAMVT